METERKIWEKKSFVVYICLLLIIVLINVLAWKSNTFCNWYVKNIFPIWGITYGKLTSLFQFSIGEIMLYIAALLTCAILLLFLLTIIPFKFLKKVKKMFVSMLKIYAWIALSALGVLTLNCFVLYHATGFEEKYSPKAMDFLTIIKESQVVLADEISGNVLDDDGIIIEQSGNREKKVDYYSYNNLATLRDYIVTKCNMLAHEMNRDECGNIIYDKDMVQASIDAMKKMGKSYEQLDGFYVTPKKFANSHFFSQQYIMGYYFPFSMEANINDVMYMTNVPPTVCHELAHTKGFIFEDDANMIGYLACINADDSYVEYCGYLSVLNYVNNDFFTSIGKSKTKYSKHIKIDPLVINDNVFLTDDAWGEVEKKAVVSTKVVKKVSNKITNTTLKLNGVEEGMMQYNKVVDQLLRYYDGLLY